ncbi:MAG TPA: helix-turn-helix domain-containing protein [Coleofasciculaceae cyanobacterium]
MKTLEFKLKLHNQQQADINQWLDGLRFVCNRGLSLLEETQQRRCREKYKAILPNGLVLKYRNDKLTGIGIRK